MTSSKAFRSRGGAPGPDGTSGAAALVMRLRASLQDAKARSKRVQETYCNWHTSGILVIAGFRYS